MKKGDKKGLSTIVATLIIILLSIAAFAVVVTVIMPLVQDKGEEIKLSDKCLEVEIHATKIAEKCPSGSDSKFVRYEITLSRTATGETIDGVKIILTNATDVSVSEDLEEEIKVLDKFPVDFADTTINFEPVRVSLYPFFIKESGDKYYCSTPWINELPLQPNLVVPCPNLP